jgi:hypothetical protein
MIRVVDTVRHLTARARRAVEYGFSLEPSSWSGQTNVHVASEPAIRGSGCDSAICIKIIKHPHSARGAYQDHLLLAGFLLGDARLEMGVPHIQVCLLSGS